MITQNKVKLIRITVCKRHNIAARAIQGNITKTENRYRLSKTTVNESILYL